MFLIPLFIFFLLGLAQSQELHRSRKSIYSTRARTLRVSNIIEYRLPEADDEPLTFRLENLQGQPRLLTFPASVSVKDFVKDKRLNDILGCSPEIQASRHSQLMKLDASSSLTSLLEREASVELICPRFSLHFVPSVKTQIPDASSLPKPLMLGVNDDEFADTERDYPYDALELIGQTLSGVMGWVENWLKWHYGKLHPFDTYSLQGFETGVYDLGTGEPIHIEDVNVVSLADRKHRHPGFVARTRETEGEIRMVMMGDWGAGTIESDYVAKMSLRNQKDIPGDPEARANATTPFLPHYSIHVGDVYYVGSPDEVESNCLGIAPRNCKNGVRFPDGSRGTFALNGNHEMYSRGLGIFDRWFPEIGSRNTTGSYLGQKASYFALQNEYWRFIAFDTAYNSYSLTPNDKDNLVQPDPVINWLRDVVKLDDPNDRRGLVFLSHHQPFSAFAGTHLQTPNQVAKLLGPNNNRTVLWLYGHEHQLNLYDLQTIVTSTDTDSSHVQPTLTLYSRCFGHGGHSADVRPLPANAQKWKLKAYDGRSYRIENGFTSIELGWNGFLQFRLLGPKMSIDYYSLVAQPNQATNSSVPARDFLSPTQTSHVISEMFVVDPDKGIVQTDFQVLNPQITVVV